MVKSEEQHEELDLHRVKATFFMSATRLAWVELTKAYDEVAETFARLVPEVVKKQFRRGWYPAKVRLEESK